VASYAAFLRGMNVGAHRRVRKEDLIACFEAAGFEDVTTFRTAGNVIFSVPGRASAAPITKRAEQGLANGLGYDVVVFLRSAAQLKAIAEFEPFPAKAVEASKGKLQVQLLGKAPTAAAKKRALALATDQDPLVIEGAELYWLPSGGTLESELDRKAMDKALGQGTMRTKGTMDLVAAKC
jgi:uncharacterized protein (DUF1697 family)